MTKSPSGRSCNPDMNSTSCQVEAVLSIDSGGQIVLPKEVRKRANLHNGDKLALISWMNMDEICSLAMIRTDNLSSEVSGVMHSLLADKD